MNAARARFDARVAALSPAAYGMVMATGIVSLAAQLLGVPLLPRCLFALDAAAFVIVSVLALARLHRHRHLVIEDLFDHARAPGYFSLVAACSILGSQCLLLGGSTAFALGFGAVALAAWICMTYGVFAALTVKRDKPSLDRGINGGWLLAVVATQSLAVLAAMLAGAAGPSVRVELDFFALSMWLWGGMLYIWMMSLIFHRYTFYAFSPADLSPPYWINMGAMAIATLAGSLLALGAPRGTWLHSMLPFIQGFTILFWATGTWWIPMLIVLGIWRHGVHRFPFSYDPMYWAAVFPLGMYAVATDRMMQAFDLPFLGLLPQVMALAALAAWAIVFVGQLRALARDWRAGAGRLRT